MYAARDVVVFECFFVYKTCAAFHMAAVGRLYVCQNIISYIKFNYKKYCYNYENIKNKK